MNPTNPSNKLNTLESVVGCSCSFSLKTALKLNAWLAVAATFYDLNLFLAKAHPEWGVTMRAISALSPLVPGILYIRSQMRFARGLDELQRRIQLEAWLFAALGTLIAGIIVSTLNASGFQWGDLGRSMGMGWGFLVGDLGHGLGMGRAFIVSLVLWRVGSALANHRYK